MPNAPTNDPSTTSTLSDNEYDALAELFLGAQAESSPPLRLHRQNDSNPAPAAPEPQASTPATIEALILGHLPILAGPWVAQYARHIADTQHESVGLLRIYAGQCSLDIFPTRPLPGELASTSHLHQAIQSASPHVDRWVIRVDATDEPALASTAGINTLTLLSSTDDAAVVSAYQTIKRLDPVADPDALPRAVRVVFIGATDRESLDASGKLTRAVGAFLETPVQTDTGPVTLSPCAGHNLYRGDAPQNLESLLAQLTNPAPKQSCVPTPSQPTRPSAHRSVAPPSQSHPASSTTPLRPVAQPSPSKTSQLVAHLPELRDLGITCPYASGVSLVCDREGNLHLLCAHTDTSFQSLQVVRAWALDHAALLATVANAQGLGDGLLDANATITSHIFTHRVDRVRRLLDAPVQIHLLTDVTVNNTVTQACVLLNC